jgi:arsenate reductase
VNVTLYHNPRCSKSRAALELLRESGHDVDVVEYLRNPPDTEVLTRIAAALDGPVAAMIRPKEAVWAEAGVDPATLDDEALLEFVARHPKALERPIAVAGRRAIVGRPPERVLELLR